MNKRRVTILKTIIFLCLMIGIFFGIQKTVSSPSDPRNYQLIRGFYAEPEDSLDAVFIGGSNAYSFFQPPAIWAAEGIKTASFSCNGNRLTAAKYFIEEVRKTQHDPLFIIVFNEYATQMKEDKIHYHTDYLPFSINKVRLIEELCSRNNISGTAKLEYYFPLIRYHSRWKELTEADFHYSLEGLKGGMDYDTFVGLPSSTGVPVDPTVLPLAIQNFRETRKKTKMPKATRRCLDELLDYCDANHLRVLFVHAPQIVSQEELEVYNSIDKRIRKRGYRTVNLCNHMEEIGYNMYTDFYNPLHNNVHGSLKVSKYFAAWLNKHYDLGSPNRDDAVWNEAWLNYRTVLAPYVTPAELDAVED